MISLWRILIVLSLALLSMQGVLAHEHAVSSDHAAAMRMASNAGDMQGMAGDTAHCAEMAEPGMPCHHSHSFCCSTSCGVHCGALLVALRFEPHVAGSAPPLPVAESQRAGVTHVPLLRPPIG